MTMFWNWYVSSLCFDILPMSFASSFSYLFPTEPLAFNHLKATLLHLYLTFNVTASFLFSFFTSSSSSPLPYFSHSLFITHHNFLLLSKCPPVVTPYFSPSIILPLSLYSPLYSSSPLPPYPYPPPFLPHPLLLILFCPPEIGFYIVTQKLTHLVSFILIVPSRNIYTFPPYLLPSLLPSLPSFLHPFLPFFLNLLLL